MPSAIEQIDNGAVQTQTHDSELSLTGPGGLGARAKGYRLIDLIWLPMLLGIGYIALTLYNHQVEAKDEKVTIANTLKESNANIAAALKESQADVAKSMREIAEQQRRANEIGREQTCLLTLPPDRRTNAGDFCKRLSRERDR